ncbi:unnamed protein product [Rhizoctonia solani]|uniref:Uncharacterized protein n=1 Tax=Rhizoctonia solani TaxID=456999 RepID=A0A8H3BBC9_9AGAM|nr:unnamed protein product [Rhizoctonia solani]
MKNIFIIAAIALFAASAHASPAPQETVPDEPPVSSCTGKEGEVCRIFLIDVKCCEDGLECEGAFVAHCSNLRETNPETNAESEPEVD